MTNNKHSGQAYGEIMVDGTEAFLTRSGRYYCRAEPSYADREKIVYYNNKKEHIPLASGTCPSCGDFIESKWAGNFQSCSCGKCFVDTDRWEPERHRFGGLLAEPSYVGEMADAQAALDDRKAQLDDNLRRTVKRPMSY